MEWRDSGFVLSARRHGENALIVELLTAEHGRHAGLVRAGQSPRRRALLQPGNRVAVHWRGRLPAHLGSFECELLDAHAARLLDDADRLAALTAAVALLLAALPEREPHLDLFASFEALLLALSPGAAIATPTLPSPACGGGFNEALNPPHARPAPFPARGGGLGWGRPTGGLGDSPAAWAQAYVLWECDLLAALGFGLDLGRCAATGSTDDLAYVSPRTGCAVSREVGLPYRDTLLPLPRFLWSESTADAAGIAAGLAMTRHFLLHHLLQPQGGKLPEARERLAERMRRKAAAGIILADGNKV
jgi:DNA repair protein RecO (recombination protein O)